ncbi:UDP-N-acetylglucosamine--undecaprenyl-phosphate N-acetylglucosaminephosphotransferase [Dickeya sp. CFBP 2040]|uniref:UDP-N-acetylglucosamine--undecaprenyl-phosphate N-acetylglucosaminephosphotransferase n=1 Tax=Dickeya sp. CFBP 2040 TaxID=2718531 RepID=UPI001448A012|nr:UDP-N-acetylglucosamine--undecaprenyl-phosphate N-acetylglucosaminephosphotransferase [Dickeya sp. CFBP 2040]NKI73560.1 UDP-N-acetylglucosamine--undecaprenyl-phosphate N-acetylglucosaminephosphotransferase [Dickeya sp. CFBP 2040]
MSDFLLVFVSAFGLLFIARKAAKKVGLVDKPNSRKKHHGHIPLAGGISIYLSLWVMFVFHSDWLPSFNTYMLCASGLLLIGVLDDRFDLPVLPRVALQALTAMLMMWSGLYLSSFGRILGQHELLLGIVGYVITLFAVWGAINAFNMVDGIDGLLGCLSCITFGAIALVFSLKGREELALWSLCFLAATLPYIVLNLGLFGGMKFKVFMGDAGSTLIGFTVIWVLIIATQGEHAVMQPVTALWVIAIPLMDMAAVMIKRIRRGNSPFRPDREHLHHILMLCGFSSRQTLLIIMGMALLLALIGVVCEWYGVPEYMMLLGFIGVFVAYCLAIARIVKVLTWKGTVTIMQPESSEGMSS